MAKRKKRAAQQSGHSSSSAQIRGAAIDATTITKQSTFSGTMAGFIIAALGFFLYLPSIRFEYVLDDNMMYTENRFVQEGFSGIGKILSTESFTGFFGEQKNLLVGGRYRPLSLVSFAIEKGLFGQHAALSHFINLLLYALLGYLTYHTLRRIFTPQEKETWWLSLAGLASLLYILHPLHSEAVANVKGRDEIMAALGGIGALYASWRYAQDNSIRWNLIAALVFFLGLLSKEHILTFTAVIPLSLYCFSSASKKQLLINTATLMLVSVLYVLLRFVIIGDVLSEIETAPNPMNDPFVNLSEINKYATIFLTLGWYLKLLIFPHPLTHDYYPYHVPVVGFDDWRAIFGLVSFLFLGGIATWSLWRKSVPTFSVAFYLLTLSIVSNLPFTVGAFMNERFLFLPSLGFTLFLAWFVTNYLPQRLGRHQGQFYTIGTGLVLMVALSYAAKTYTRLPAWHDGITLNATDYKTSKGSARMKLFKAADEFRTEFEQLSNEQKVTRINDWIAIAEEAVRILPEYRAAWGFMAGLAGERYRIDGRIQPMLDVFAKAAVYDPNGRSIHDFCKYIKPSQGEVQPELADFAYTVGYLHFAQKKGDLEHARQYLLYGFGTENVDPKIIKALQSLR